MPIIAPKSENKFEPVPSGNHVARVYRIIHLGTIVESYMGEDKEMNKIVVGFELPNEKKVFKEERGDEPYVISREYTLSMNEKANLRKLVEGMYGVILPEEEANMFDVTSIVGKECLLNVVHQKAKNGNMYALIQGASPIPKGMDVPVAYNPVQILDYQNWDKALFESLPDFYKEKIESSKEWKELTKIPF